MRYRCTLLLCLLFAGLFAPGVLVAGSIDSPAAPTDAASAMFTLDDLYNRLLNGAAGSKRLGAFAEPLLTPAATGHTVDQIMALAPARDDTNGAVVTDVLAGKTFWQLRSGNWGLATGTLAQRTLDAGSTTVQAGYYAATTLSTVDTDLASGNIRAGVNIFGIDGNSNVVNTSTGTAANSDILSGKTAWVDGAQRTGNISTQTLSSTSTDMPAGYYAGTTLSGVASNLASGNIKSGVEIFGVTGASSVVDTSTGDAAAGDILSGKIAWVDGAAVTGTIAVQTLSAASTTVNAGYYAATNLATVDPDLASGNIKSGKNIFGVDGSPTVLDTSAGTAQASYVAGGKVTYAAGTQVVGLRYPGTVPARVAKTGQTVSYAARDDGNLGVGAGNVYPRFTDNGNGTTTDNLTGLIWLKNANCNYNALTWAQALTYANALASGSCGLTDGSTAGQWRLPNHEELASLTHDAFFSPTLSNTAGTGQWIEGDPFTGVESNYYWSSTTYAGNMSDAWSVRLDIGIVSKESKTAPKYVWPVRGGQ